MSSKAVRPEPSTPGYNDPAYPIGGTEGADGVRVHYAGLKIAANNPALHSLP